MIRLPGSMGPACQAQGSDGSGPAPFGNCRSGNLHRDAVSAMGYVIVFVEIHQPGPEVDHFLLAQDRIGTDDDSVSGPGFMRRRTVDGHHTRSTRGANRISRKAFAIVNVINLDLLILMNTGSLEQIFINGTGPFVLKLGMSDAGAMQFGF